MEFHDDFKAALALLPSKEKDRLLWRLIKRDELLARRLEFELLAPYDAIDKRNELAERIGSGIVHCNESGWRLVEILSQCRRYSAEITRHVYVTKDKVGEVTLNFVLLQEALRLLYRPPFRFSYRVAEKYVTYMLNKLYRTCILIHKLHVDYHIELEDEAQKLGEIINMNPDLAKHVKSVKFRVEWLVELDIPDDIDKIYKTIKQQGLLK